MDEENRMPISRKLLRYNMILSLGIMLSASFLLARLITPRISILSIFQGYFTAKTVIVLVAGCILLFVLQLFFITYISRDGLKDEINRYLMDYFSLPELFAVFFLGALSEELLFRGVIQFHLGIWISSILFAVIHFRYLRKIFLLTEVFLMGMILGCSYLLTQSLWVPICCHWSVNYITAVFIKRGYIEY
ncbi:MAG: hypothetical protein AWM53_01205 [Candidatus Dichloromethanomonas elyunquensis]|nr:MAG: hypothetical protein AWM53_01205 [Candidatus Dichloromethanomonas elyunquensis]